jgi:hypothetical protein
MFLWTSRYHRSCVRVLSRQAHSTQLDTRSAVPRLLTPHHVAHVAHVPPSRSACFPRAYVFPYPSLEGIPEAVEQSITVPLRGAITGQLVLELTLQRN